MRFEINSGGIAAILVGIAALSGAVFMLGLLAGYDVGRESQSSAAQVATAYPVAAPAPDAAAASAPAATASPPPMAMAPPSPAPHSASPPATRVATAKPFVAKPPKAPAQATTPRAAADEYDRSPGESAPPSGEVSAPGEGPDTGDEEGGVVESRPVTRPTPRPVARTETGSGVPGLPAHHKPFNIQIEAAMDRNGATQMARRLQALGYQSHLVPAPMNGQTWYKVVIGPYPTQEAAAAAQQQMRIKYNNLYGGAGSSSTPTD